MKPKHLLSSLSERQTIFSFFFNSTVFISDLDGFSVSHLSQYSHNISSEDNQRGGGVELILFSGQWEDFPVCRFYFDCGDCHVCQDKMVEMMRRLSDRQRTTAEDGGVLVLSEHGAYQIME